MIFLCIKRTFYFASLCASPFSKLYFYRLLWYSRFIKENYIICFWPRTCIYDLQVRLVAGPLPIPLPRDYSGLMQLENANRGPIVLGCAVPLMPERPLPNSTVPELLELVATGPTAPRVKRARLGCPSEARLLASPKMQRLLSACR